MILYLVLSLIYFGNFFFCFRRHLVFFFFSLLSFLLSMLILLHVITNKVSLIASSSYHLPSFISRNDTTCCLYYTLFVSYFSFLPFIIYLLLFVLCVLLFVKYSNVKLQFFFVFNYWVDIILVSFFSWDDFDLPWLLCIYYIVASCSLTYHWHFNNE